jgi:hypothetical protein
MYQKNNKQYLYWLMSEYLSLKIDENYFCDEFHDSFVNALDLTALSHFEIETFSNLLEVVQCFSEYESDHLLWSGFSNEKQLKDKVLETISTLENGSEKK